MKRLLIIVIAIACLGMRPVNNNIFSGLAGDVTQTSGVLDSEFITAASFQAFITGTPSGTAIIPSNVAGTLFVQASNDPLSLVNPAGVVSPLNWSTIGSASISGSVATAGTTIETSATMIGVNNIMYRWLMLVWTNTSGTTGNINANGFMFGF